MANKTIHEFFAPSVASVAIGHTIINVYVNFKLNLTLVIMVQASPFCGKAHEDANAHLQHFSKDMCNLHHQRSNSRGHQAPSILILLTWKGEAMVLLEP